MDIEYFRNFIMMVDSQTLTEAAKRLNMVQPALSAQLKQIETNYKADLIITHRGGRRIELTEAGQLFYRRAKDIVRLADELKHEVQGVAQGEEGTLRISITPGAVNGFIDTYLQPFTKENPQFRSIFSEGNVDQQAEALLNGVSDIGVMNEPIPRGYLFELLTIRYRSLSAVMSNQQQWLKKPLQPLTIEDLAGVPLCVTRSLATRLESFFRERGLHQDISAVCSTNLFAMHWARRNMGIAVIMGEPDEDTGIGLTTMPIATEEIMGAEHIYTVKDRKLTTIAQKFCDFIRERN